MNKRRKEKKVLNSAYRALDCWNYIKARKFFLLAINQNLGARVDDRVYSNLAKCSLTIWNTKEALQYNHQASLMSPGLLGIWEARLKILSHGQDFKEIKRVQGKISHIESFLKFESEKCLNKYLTIK